MRKKSEPLGLVKAILCFILGLTVGSVFIFGMQFWNEKVDKNACTKVTTQMNDYKLHYRKGHLREITIYCSNSKKYYIDSVSITDEITDELSKISKNDDLYLLIHPNSNTVVEFNVNNEQLLNFDKTIALLDKEATGFVFIGIFMYLGAFISLYYIIYHVIQKIKYRKK